MPSLIHANRIKMYNKHPNAPIPVPDVRNHPRREDPPPLEERTHLRRPKEQDQVPKPTGTEPRAQEPKVDFDDSTYFAFERLLRVRKINGKPHFLVKWKDGSPNTWEPEENLSDASLREYYSTHTKSGRKRKRNNLDTSISHSSK